MCILITVIALFIPLFGPLITMVLALYFRSIAHKHAPPQTAPIVIPEYFGELPLIFSGATMGSIAARLRFSLNENERIRSISRIIGSQYNEQYSLLSTALSDSAEEVRMLAYSALDLRENDNTMQMIELDRLLQKVKNPIARRKILENKAWLVWNIEHQQSMEEQQREASANENLDSTSASDSGPEMSGGMALLHGLRALERRQLQQAIDFFHTAQQNGVPVIVVAPHLATAYYELGCFAEVKALLSAHKPLILSPRYGASALFWRSIQA